MQIIHDPELSQILSKLDCFTVLGRHQTSINVELKLFPTKS